MRMSYEFVVNQYFLLFQDCQQRAYSRERIVHTMSKQRVYSSSSFVVVVLKKLLWYRKDKDKH